MSLPKMAKMENFRVTTVYIKNIVLAGVAQWVEYWTVNQKVTGSVPCQDTCLGLGPGP